MLTLGCSVRVPKKQCSLLRSELPVATLTVPPIIFSIFMEGDERIGAGGGGGTGN
jgi:hypothetical protein